MQISTETLTAAERRMTELRARGYAVAAHYANGAIVVDLHDGRQLQFGIASYDDTKARTLAIARGERGVLPGEPKIWIDGDLAVASEADLAEIKISPNGLGLHWPRLDADFYLPPLLQELAVARMAAEVRRLVLN